MLAQETPTPTATPSFNPMDMLFCILPRVKNKTPLPRVMCMAGAAEYSMECFMPRLSCLMTGT